MTHINEVKAFIDGATSALDYVISQDKEHPSTNYERGFRECLDVVMNAIDHITEDKTEDEPILTVSGERL